MRDASALNAKWSMLGAVWSRRRAIFYGVSAVSLAGNVVVLAESLQVRASIAGLLQRLLPHGREAATTVVAQLQRPGVLYMLLNLLMLCVLLKSGLLAGRASTRQFEVRAMKENVVGGWTKLSSSSLLHLQGNDGELMQMSNNKKSSNDVLMACDVEPSKSYTNAPNIGADHEQPKVRRASLFTIEPLIVGEPSPSLVGAGTTQPFTATSHNEEPANHEYHESSLNDYILNHQEFNARVEGFISKFKRNLTMQREDSLNRLLALMGKR